LPRRRTTASDEALLGFSMRVPPAASRPSAAPGRLSALERSDARAARLARTKAARLNAAVPPMAAMSAVDPTCMHATGTQTERRASLLVHTFAGCWSVGGGEAPGGVKGFLPMA
jgi:hypothetical protein